MKLVSLLLCERSNGLTLKLSFCANEVLQENKGGGAQGENKYSHCRLITDKRIMVAKTLTLLVQLDGSYYGETAFPPSWFTV